MNKKGKNKDTHVPPHIHTCTLTHMATHMHTLMHSIIFSYFLISFRFSCGFTLMGKPLNNDSAHTSHGLPHLAKHSNFSTCQARPNLVVQLILLSIQGSLEEANWRGAEHQAATEAQRTKTSCLGHAPGIWPSKDSP